MLFGFLILLLVFLSLNKLGLLIRRLFINDENSSWFVDSFVGTVFFTFGLLLLSFFNLRIEWAGLFLPLGWILVKNHSKSYGLIFTSLVVCLIGGFSFWLQGYLMSVNPDYPVRFFNVDTPFTLMLAKSFQAQTGYPPLLLENEGMSLKYHYGYHILLAFLSNLSGIKVHVVHSLFLLPWMFLLQVGLLVSFLKKFAKVKWLVAGALTFVIGLGYQQYLFNYFNPDTVKNLIVLPNRYTSLYPLGPSTFEGPIFIFIVWLLWIKKKGSLLFASLVLMLIPLYKIPVAPAIGLGFGIACVYFAWYEKNWRYFLYPIGGAIGMLLVFKIFSSPSLESPDIELLSASHVQKDQWFSVMMPLLFVIALQFITKRKIVNQYNTWLLAFILPLPILLLIVNINDVNVWQLISIAPFAAWFISVFLIAENFPRFLPIIQKSTIILGILVIFIPVANAIFYVVEISQNPEFGHEFCDNNLLQKKLKKIPVKECVIATNDLRYPAENFSRDGNQFQFSAIYGHQMKVSNMSYLVTKEFVEQVLAFQAKLPNSPPDQKDIEFLKSEGVTHFVLAHSDSTAEGNPVKAYHIFDIKK